MGQFAAQIEEWVQKVDGLAREIFQESAQRVRDEMLRTRVEGGSMRVKTGFLRASLMASTAGMPTIRPGNRPPSDAGPNLYEPTDVALVINGADIGDTIYLGFTADYARPREAKDGFVRLTAMQWQDIVAGVVRDVQAGAGRGLPPQ